MSAYFSIVPLLGIWIIWIPAGIILIIQQEYWNSLIVILFHVITVYYLQPIIYSYIPGNPYFVGLSIVLGITRFGVLGAIYGPLLAGFAITFFDLFSQFYFENTKRKKQ